MNARNTNTLAQANQYSPPTLEKGLSKTHIALKTVEPNLAERGNLARCKF